MNIKEELERLIDSCLCGDYYDGALQNISKEIITLLKDRLIIKRGDIVSYKGINVIVEEVLNNEIRIKGKKHGLSDDVEFYTWIKIADLY